MVTKQTLRREIGGRTGAAQFFKKSFDTDELFNALKKFCAFETHPPKASNGHFNGGGH